MSPGGRRGRTIGSSEESHLRDLSPATTLRAFTQKPMPFDTTRDEYKIFGCIESLTPAERDLGARVAKAAQRLKSWCAEIEQWGWTGSFEQPSEEHRERRRRSLELRIREHIKDPAAIESIGPLEYCGSLLSVEVEAHESRLDEIGDELLTLDIEELKEHVLDIHGPNRSRPSSAGVEMTRQNYTPMDDFSFLITQTLLAALPNHFQLKDRLSTWTARVCVLRDAPRYLSDLKTAQKAMKLGWDAIEPPTDTSDVAFDKWKEAIDTISGVLQDQVSHLGQRLDRMLDALEGHEDRLPEGWIDIFEAVEADYGRWAHDSRKRVMEFDMRRRVEQKNVVRMAAKAGDSSERLMAHSDQRGTSTSRNGERPLTTNEAPSQAIDTNDTQDLKSTETVKDAVSHVDKESKTTQDLKNERDDRAIKDVDSNRIAIRSATAFKTGVPELPSQRSEPVLDHRSQALASGTVTPLQSFIGHVHEHSEAPLDATSQESASIHSFPIPRYAEASIERPEPVKDDESSELVPAPEQSPEDESFFEEGDTVVHNEVEDDTPSSTSGLVQVLPESTSFSDSSVIVSLEDRPRTPVSRRSSIDSITSDISFSSSPPGALEDSPSVRNTTNRHAKAPRPALNAAMGKRRAPKKEKELSIADAPPWPPTQFSKANSADDLERKISDILTTIPAHIRLTTSSGADAREAKPRRGLTAKGSKNYLRATRSRNDLKSPELTLSPARSDFDSSNAASGRKSAAAMRGDNDIKLYHLTQPGKEHPIKLFIRRVGENGERVMVRVGGGWADLGEYLRQYAEHHGRRAVSDGKFEILGLEVPQMSPGRPESSMSSHDRRFSGGGPQSGSPNTTPKKSTGAGILKDDSAPPVPTISTPGIAGDSTPSTGASRTSWKGDEVGLSGPKTKKIELSGERKEWVEGMMKQARTVSGTLLPRAEHAHAQHGNTERAESRSESRTAARKVDFGDLGKVGGTKRIFLRGGGLSEH